MFRFALISWKLDIFQVASNVSLVTEIGAADMKT